MNTRRYLQCTCFQGHNRVIAYSRPFYFALCTSLLLLFNFLADASNANLPGIPIYGVTFFDNAGCAAGRDVMLGEWAWFNSLNVCLRLKISYCDVIILSASSLAVNGE